ncbi:hypothetical protein AVEN_248146-1 [Araneus ventricosus]|uniref:Uncharacterized protein n=1 Tax=Araneus ventricosus TaxID=182803 RepID=A0A4Y2P3X8_ARAVE|nr:hypothetical protein AVEN_248146-1 [Araneus ventricosus]
MNCHMAKEEGILGIKRIEGICDNYVRYVRSKFKSTALVIFDGYPENETIGGNSFPRNIPGQSEEQGSTHLHPDEQVLLNKHDMQESRRRF